MTKITKKEKIRIEIEAVIYSIIKSLNEKLKIGTDFNYRPSLMQLDAHSTATIKFGFKGAYYRINFDTSEVNKSPHKITCSCHYYTHLPSKDTRLLSKEQAIGFVEMTHTNEFHFDINLILN